MTLVPYGPDDDPEHLDHLQVKTLLAKLRLPDDFNPYQIIRTPSEDRGKDTYNINFRLDKRLLRVIDDLVAIRRFRDRSEFFRHYTYIGLMTESGLNEADAAIQQELDSVLVFADISQQLDDEREMDDSIGLIAQALPRAQGTTKKRLLHDLERLQTICSANEWDGRLQQIDSLYANYGHVT